MTDSGRFFLPGPTEVHPDVLAAMARPMIGHRSAEFTPLLREPRPVLQGVFGTSRPVFVASASATGWMEGAVRNGARQRALALVNGAFSIRFHDLVRDCGREVETYEVAWGEVHDPAEVERRLRAGGFDALVVVHSETSTGVLNPLPEIAGAARAAEAATGEEILVLGDGVTSVGAMRVEAEAWGIDLFLTGSQKALALPPGLAFAAASERMMTRAATLPERGHYFDLLEYARYAEQHQTPTTPALPLLYALREQARRINAEGLEARFARHWAMARRCHDWAAEHGARLGLSVLAPEGARSPTVTALTLPAGRTGPAVAAEVARRGWVIGAGYGKLKENTIRIGHMGEHTVNELEELLDVLTEVLT